MQLIVKYTDGKPRVMLNATQRRQCGEAIKLIREVENITGQDEHPRLSTLASMLLADCANLNGEAPKQTTDKEQ